MKLLLKLENVAIFFLSIYLLTKLDFKISFWKYLLLFFSPDIGIAGYLINSRVGAFCYNFLHHFGLGIILTFAGMYVENNWLQLLGILFVGHSAFDRIFGFGLKYNDDFKNTHLGKMK